jgi:biopolymer transport protein ExbB/TolQ
MMNDDALRSVLKRKMRRLIDSSELLLASSKPHTLYDAHDISEITIRKLKLQLELNSLLLEEVKNNGDKKKLEEERKELQDALATELENGLEILNTIVASLRLDGKTDKARQLEILRDVRESERDEFKS